VAGALPEAELVAALAAAGFVDVAIVARHDMYQDGPRGPGAVRYGAYGVTMRARRPGDGSLSR
jgi:hypothetical protein